MARICLRTRPRASWGWVRRPWKRGVAQASVEAIAGQCCDHPHHLMHCEHVNNKDNLIRNYYCFIGFTTQKCVSPARTALSPSLSFILVYVFLRESLLLTDTYSLYNGRCVRRQALLKSVLIMKSSEPLSLCCLAVNVVKCSWQPKALSILWAVPVMRVSLILLVQQLMH